MAMEGIKHYFRRFTSGAQTATTLITPASGMSIIVYGYEISSGSIANSVQLELPDTQRTNDTTNFASFEFSANGGANLTAPFPLAEGNASAVLSVTSSANTVLSIGIWYEEKVRI